MKNQRWKIFSLYDGITYRVVMAYSRLDAIKTAYTYRFNPNFLGKEWSVKLDVQ